LKDNPDVQVVAQGKNGLEAVQLVKEHQPDLMFLDVQMPGLDGFGVVKKLVAAKVPMPMVAFATAFDEYAVKAFEVNALDYILKPYDKGRVQQVVERAKRQSDAQEGSSAEPPQLAHQEEDKLAALLKMLERRNAQQGPTKVLLRSQGRMFLVDQREICFASINDGVITVVTSQMEGESSVRTLEELQEMLHPNLFWRAHRGYLVNINRIREVVPWFKSSYQLRMDDRNHTEIPVSRAQTKRLRELFKL
jgi:two-component system, LytTR family, response regulator LytT